MQATNALPELKSSGLGAHLSMHMTPPADMENGVMDRRLHVAVLSVVNAPGAPGYHAFYTAVLPAQWRPACVVRSGG
ncbi:hypothetical protein GCM10028792_34330 [Salinisphaera aquimarina]